MALHDHNYLTVNQVAEILRLNPQTIRNWINAGKLPALHIGRRVRINREDLDAFIATFRPAVAASTSVPTGADFWNGILPDPVIPPSSTAGIDH